MAENLALWGKSKPYFSYINTDTRKANIYYIYVSLVYSVFFLCFFSNDTGMDQTQDLEHAPQVSHTEIHLQQHFISQNKSGNTWVWAI